MEEEIIAIVDDDQLIVDMIQGGLYQHGYKVLCASNSKELLKILETNKVQTILLDLGLPDGDGLTLISNIRNLTDAPIIIISARKEMIDKVVGLEMGADDYLAKPFELRELLARIKANARRYQGSDISKGGPSKINQECKSFKFGPWTLDRDRYQVYDENGLSGELTTQEFQLLEVLVLSPNKVFTRDHLFELLKKDTYDGYDRALDVQITRIRKKIGDNATSPHFIKAVRGVGYMMICDTKASD